VESDEQHSKRLIDLVGRASHLGPIEVLSASTGNEAFHLFDNHHPDLFIINSSISGIGSRDVCRWIRANEGERHTGIIFIAGANVDEDKLSVDCLTQGADDFLRITYTQDELLARLNTVLRLKFMTDDLRRANYKLRMLTLTDELTGMANMRCFREHFARAVHRCSNREMGLSVIMLDLDHFKQVNDKINHLVGSYVLSEAGRMIREAKVIGSEDLAARYGGDEFIICSEVTEITYAMHKAMAIREMIESAIFKYDGCSVTLTASVGVAWVKPGFQGPKNDIIKLADAMLYRSKRLGRNRVSSMELRYPIDFDFVSKTQNTDDVTDEILPVRLDSKG
jgi:diguanylate cyclase (GGDEF)-like protein